MSVTVDNILHLPVRESEVEPNDPHPVSYGPSLARVANAREAGRPDQERLTYISGGKCLSGFKIRMDFRRLALDDSPMPAVLIKLVDPVWTRRGKARRKFTRAWVYYPQERPVWWVGELA